MIALAISCVTARSRAEGQGFSPEGKPVDVVITGTRTPESSQRSTVKTDVVTSDEAARRGATNVADALASQPGVQVNPGAYGYLGQVNAIQIQGFDLQRVLILEDGEPVVGDIGGAIDLAAIPLGDVERIEVVSGPMSSLYGSSAIGGVVNVLTAPPRREGAASRVRIEGRSHRGLVAAATGSYRVSRNFIILDSQFTRQDGIAKIPDLPDLQIPETSRLMMGARAGATLTRRIDVRVRARWFRDRQDGLSSNLVPGLGRYLIDQPNDTDRFTIHLMETADLGGGSSLRLSLGRQWNDNTTATVARGSQVKQQHERRQRMQSFEAQATIADGARTWVTGLRAEVQAFTQDLTRVDSLSTGLVTTTQEEVRPSTLGSAALYEQLAWKLGDSFTLLPGVRGEFHASYGQAVTPRLATSFRPSQAVQLRAAIGRGYRAPSAKELGFVFDHAIYGYRVLGNADLQPESSWGTNADITWQPAPGWRGRAHGFFNWVDNLIDLDVANGTSTAGVVDYRYQNFGKARTLGGGAGGSYDVTPSLRIEIAYDYLYTRDDINDRPLGGRPAHTLTGSIRATPWTGFEAYLRTRVVSDAFVNTDVRSQGYTTVDMRVAHELWPSAQAYVGVLNLIDVRQDPGRVGDLRPPMGRSFYVGVRAELPWEEE